MTFCRMPISDLPSIAGTLSEANTKLRLTKAFSGAFAIATLPSISFSTYKSKTKSARTTDFDQLGGTSSLCWESIPAQQDADEETGARSVDVALLIDRHRHGKSAGNRVDLEVGAAHAHTQLRDRHPSGEAEQEVVVLHFDAAHACERELASALIQPPGDFTFGEHGHASLAGVERLVGLRLTCRRIDVAPP